MKPITDRQAATLRELIARGYVNQRDTTRGGVTCWGTLHALVTRGWAQLVRDVDDAGRATSFWKFVPTPAGEHELAQLVAKAGDPHQLTVGDVVRTRGVA